MTDFQLPKYLWRGRPYIGVDALCRAVRRVHRTGAISFGPDGVYVRLGRTGTTLKYPRAIVDGVNVVEDKHE